jgi:sugar O-acyltransferase (sialic acid O-acetyltransferase NeuD family)
MIERDICIIGYSGHSLVAVEIIHLMNGKVVSYCDIEEKNFNPFNLTYLGEESVLSTEHFNLYKFFVGIGDNSIRHQIFNKFSDFVKFTNIIHPQSVLALSSKMGTCTMINAGVIINPFVEIGNGVICNTNCSVDHECKIDDFAHIGPGATLCGNVTVKVGNDVIIGAGSIVLHDVPDNSKIAGCPAKSIIKNQ